MEEQGDLTGHLRWEPGMEFTAEKEYLAATAWLAKELLRDHTPEQLSVIAAQHMLYVDALKDGRDAAKELIRRKDEQIQREALKYETLIRGVAKLIRIVLNAFQKKTFGKGGKARHAETEKLKPGLLQEWDATGHGYRGRADFVRIVSKREGIKERSLYDWITKHEQKKPEALAQPDSRGYGFKRSPPPRKLLD